MLWNGASKIIELPGFLLTGSTLLVTAGLTGGFDLLCGTLLAKTIVCLLYT